MLNIPSQYMHYRLVLLCGLLCYCVRDRNHCCVLCDATRDLLFTWYIVHQPKLESLSFSQCALLSAFFSGLLVIFNHNLDLPVSVNYHFYSRFDVTRHVFRKIWHKIKRGWILLHWSWWNSLPVHPELSSHWAACSPWRQHCSKRAVNRGRVLSSWRYN